MGTGLGRLRAVLTVPVELRRIVHTADAIESLDARFGKAVRHRGAIPNRAAPLKVLSLVAIGRRPNRSHPTGQINSRKTILNALTIHYGDRVEVAHAPPPSRPPARRTVPPSRRSRLPDQLV